MEQLTIVTIEDIKARLDQGQNLHKILTEFKGQLFKTKTGRFYTLTPKGSIYEIIKRDLRELPQQTMPIPEFVVISKDLIEVIRQTVAETLSQLQLARKPMLEIEVPTKKPYMCQQCDKKFKKPGSLGKHIKMKHEGKSWILKLSPEDKEAYMNGLKEKRRKKRSLRDMLGQWIEITKKK